MNVATLKTLLWLVSLGLAAGLVAYAYDFKTSEQPSYWDADYALGVLKDVDRPEPPKARILGYRDMVLPNVTTFDWTGRPPAPPPVEEEVTEGPLEEPQIQVKDILAILMVSVDTYDPGGSMAAVLWRDAALAGSNPILRIGDELPKPYETVVVKDIGENSVEFAFTNETWDNQSLGTPRNDALISIVGPGEAPREPVARPNQLFGAQDAPTEFRDTWPTETTRTANGIFNLGSEDMTRFGNDYPRILTDDVTTETYFKDGKRAGLKIKTVKAGSIASRHGAQAGDVIISINGHPVSSEQQAIQYVKNNSEGTTVWQVVVENLGRQRTVTYNTPK